MAEGVGDYAVTQTAEMLTVRADRVSPDWEMWILSAPDVHWDSPMCQRDLLKRHLDQAKEKGALILFPGDFFDAMEGKYDPRREKQGVRPEHNVNNYLDSIVYGAAEYLRPYASNILAVMPGNHEQSIHDHCETDLTERLARELGVRKAGHEGFLRLQTSVGKSERRSTWIWWHHGEGVGGDVSRGAMRVPRWNDWVADAQILLGGHIHQSWVIWSTFVRPLVSGRVELEDRAHVCSSTYKQDFAVGQNTWHLSKKGRGPKPLGATWLHFFYDRNATGRVRFNAFRAV